MDKLEGYWSKKSILEPNTGKFYNKYFYKRKAANRVVINSKKATALAGYVLIEKDLRSALIWLNHIIELLKRDPNQIDIKGHIKSNYDRDTFNIIKGLFVSSLTFYGKCFATCEGRRIKLEKNNLDKNFYDEHDNAISFRNNFAAHSGAKKLERVAIVIALDKKKREPPYLVKELMQPDTVSINDLKSFIKLFEHAKEFTENKIRVLSDKIYKDEIIPKGPDYWPSKV